MKVGDVLDVFVDVQCSSFNVFNDFVCFFHVFPCLFLCLDRSFWPKKLPNSTQRWAGDLEATREAGRAGPGNAAPTGREGRELFLERFRFTFLCVFLRVVFVFFMVFSWFSLCFFFQIGLFLKKMFVVVCEICLAFVNGVYFLCLLVTLCNSLVVCLVEFSSYDLDLMVFVVRNLPEILNLLKKRLSWSKEFSFDRRGGSWMKPSASNTKRSEVRRRVQRSQGLCVAGRISHASCWSIDDSEFKSQSTYQIRFEWTTDMFRTKMIFGKQKKMLFFPSTSFFCFSLWHHLETARWEACHRVSTTRSSQEWSFGFWREAKSLSVLLGVVEWWKAGWNLGSYGISLDMKQG